MGGSTRESINTNTNNNSRSTKIPAPKVATQQKRDSLVSTSERSEGEEFPNRSTASTSQNVTERRYQTRSASGITRPRKLKDYFLFKDNDADEKFDNDVLFKRGYDKMQRAWNPHWIVQLNWKLLQLVSILRFSQSLEIVGYDFENILKTQKFAMTEPTNCETSHINEEQVNKGGLIYAKSSTSKLKYCMYRAAYTVTVLKKCSSYDDATYLNEKSQIIPTFYPIKESLCQNLWQEHKARLPGLGDFEFNNPIEVLNEMNVDRIDAEFVHKISKTFTKGGDEKGVNYVYSVDWINPKGETQKGNIMINAEIFMGILLIETREANEGTWLYFKDPLKQKQTLLYQGDTFEIDSVQYLFDLDKKPNILTIVKFSDSVTAKIARAGNKKYLTSKLDRKRNLVIQLKNKTKFIDNFLLFETNHRNLFYTTEKLTAK